MTIAPRNARSGFTLVELMIVIVILGILAGMMVPAVNNYLQKAKKAAAKTTIMKLRNAITSFQAQLNKYPAKLQDLTKRPKGGDERVTKKWDGPYYGDEEGADVPEDSWGEKFVYKLTPPPAPHPYELYSHGPNGKGSPKEERIDVWDKD